MARSKTRRRVSSYANYKLPPRDLVYHAHPVPYNSYVSFPSSRSVRTARLKLFPNRKQFSPSKHSIKAVQAARRKLHAKIKRQMSMPTLSTRSFSVPGIPNPLTICARRKIREAVLHALGRTGKRGQNPPRLTWRSKIKCS